MNNLQKKTAIKKQAAHAAFTMPSMLVLSIVGLVFSQSLAHAQSPYLSVAFKSPAQGSDQAPVNDATKDTKQTSPPATDMPSSLTDPVLPNVPSTLTKGAVGEPSINLVDPVKNEVIAPTKPTPPPRATVPSRSGPALLKSLSTLFTEQRPFLLYSQDASITYLMPNALVDHPALGHYLRGILEERALARWQDLRGARAKRDAAEPVDSSTNPTLMISGRVEDRFYSQDFSSLYLAETKSVGDKKLPDRISSFNFSHKDKKPFGLSDLFQSDGDKKLGGAVELIAAYVQADIIRQKTVKLGTPVTAEQDSWLKDLKPSLQLFDTFTLVPSRETGKIAGLSFHFNPGLLGAEADGSYNVFVPEAIFSPSLSNQFAESFGGEALRVSRYNAKGFSTASLNVERLKANAELGGNMLIEGEVPGNWCDGFHLTLTDSISGEIVTESLVQLLPDLPSYGLAGNMIRFRAELSVSGDGSKDGKLVFEPYPVAVADGHVVPRVDGVCQADRSIALPDSNRDMIWIPVTY